MDTKALIGALAIGPGTVAQLPFAVARDGASPGRPEDTRVNQAWLGFGPIDALTVRVGRQRIKLGNVGWRQNEQTCDGGSLEWSSDWFDLFYSYVGHVNRIAGVTNFWAMLSVALP